MKRFNILGLLLILDFAWFALSCQQIEQMPEVVADFSTNIQAVKIGESVSFTDKSTGNPTLWKRAFTGDNPENSTEQYLKQFYNIPAEYSITHFNSSEFISNTNSGKIQVMQPTDSDKDECEAFCPDGEDRPFDVVEEAPQFEGGMEAWSQYLYENLVYPEETLNKGIEGTVYVVFIIEKNGKLSCVEILRGIDPRIDEEAIRLIRCAPKWIPGKQNGQIVRVKMRLPIRFKVPD